MVRVAPVPRVLLIVPVALAVAAPAQAKITGFQTPSKRIGCAVIDQGKRWDLRCDVTGATNTPPPKPVSCEFDYGFSFGLTATGKGRRLCVSDTPLSPSFKVLAYGKTYKRGPFACKSRQSGLRCTNKRGHGFELARERQRVF